MEINDFTFGLSRVQRYRFYDTPDNQDFFKKLGYCVRWGGSVGLVASSIDVLLLSHPPTYGLALGRYISITGPFMGMAAAFSSITYLSANIRNKDDQFNHFWGGVAAGMVFGRWRKSYLGGTQACVYLGLFALAKKFAEMNEFPLLPTKFATSFNIATGANRDYTLTKDDKPRSWTTDPNDVQLDTKAIIPPTPFNIATP